MPSLHEPLLEAVRQIGDRLLGWPALVPAALTMVAVAAFALAMTGLILAYRTAGRARRLEEHYRRLMSGTAGEQLEDVLAAVIARLDAVEGQASTVGRHARNIDVGLESAIQRVRLVRYANQGQTGAASSFSLALLDANDNGVVVSALAGRERTRVYAKAVRSGRSPHALSLEEQRAVTGQDLTDDSD